VSGPSARESYGAQQAMTPWATRAFRWYVAVIAIGLLVAWAESSTFRQLLHDLRVQAPSGVVQDQFSRTATFTNLLSLVTLTMMAPFYILVLIWQHRGSLDGPPALVPAWSGSPVGFVMAAGATVLVVGFAHFGVRTVRCLDLPTGTPS
jgi:hypothetical protein